MGDIDGCAVGTIVGFSVGGLVGFEIGTMVGFSVGGLVGIEIGTIVGIEVGGLVGIEIGCEVGMATGSTKHRQIISIDTSVSAWESPREPPASRGRVVPNLSRTVESLGI